MLCFFLEKCALHFCSTRSPFPSGQHHRHAEAALKVSGRLPAVGFSHTVVQILHSLDVLTNEVLHQELKEYSSWPTFRQHYIDGVSQNTNSKMCSAFLINAATVSRWSALTSCQSSARRF